MTQFLKIGKYVINPKQITSIHLNDSGGIVKFSDGAATLLDGPQIDILFNALLPITVG